MKIVERSPKTEMTCFSSEVPSSSAHIVGSWKISMDDFLASFQAFGRINLILHGGIEIKLRKLFCVLIYVCKEPDVYLGLKI